MEPWEVLQRSQHPQAPWWTVCGPVYTATLYPMVIIREHGTLSVPTED